MFILGVLGVLGVRIVPASQLLRHTPASYKLPGINLHVVGYLGMLWNNT